MDGNSLQEKNASLKRFLVDTDTLLSKGCFALPVKEAHHLINVLRLRQGDKIELIDGKGHIALAEIVEISHKKSDKKVMVLTEKNQLFSEKIDDTLPIILTPSLLAATKMDIVIQKATEIGVKRILPVITQYSIQRKKYSMNKRDRWQQIAYQALKQCKGINAPIIDDPVSIWDIRERLVDLLNKDNNYCLSTCNIDDIYEHSLKIMLSPYPSASLHEALMSLKFPVILLTGPEGGLTPKETSYLEKLGFLGASISRRILRAETASIIATGIVAYMLQFTRSTLTVSG